jgi:hypothetical protein
MLVLLDVVVGVAFVYLLLALICTTANEWIASARGLRGKALEKGIGQLLGPLAGDFHRHPLIATLSEPGKRPSYIPAHIFSSAVLDVIGRHAEGAPTAQQVRAGIAALTTRQAAPSAGHAAHAAALEDWFNTAMDRVSGGYKRRLQVITVGVAAIVTLAVNADTLQIIGVLWHSPADRAAIVEQARERLQPPTPVVAARYPDVNSPVPPVSDQTSAEDQDSAAPAAAAPSTIGQLVGWSSDFKRLNQGVCTALQDHRDRDCAAAAKAASCQQALRRIAADDRCSVEGADLVATDAAPGGAFLSSALLPVAATHTFGWLLTIIAISLGAAFWFDTLNRFVNIRGTGPAPAEKKAAGA